MFPCCLSHDDRINDLSLSDAGINDNWRELHSQAKSHGWNSLHMSCYILGLEMSRNSCKRKDRDRFCIAKANTFRNSQMKTNIKDVSCFWLNEIFCFVNHVAQLEIATSAF